MGGLVIAVMKVSIRNLLVPNFILSVVLCSPVCANGYCVQTNSCVCDPGWTGDRCRIGESSKYVHVLDANVNDVFLKILMNAVMVSVINFA